MSIIFTPDYDVEDEKYSRISISNQDIISVLDLESFNASGNNEIDLSLKIYVSNYGSKDSGEIFIELYLLKNGTSIAEAKSTRSIVMESNTKIFYINITVITGNYEIQLMIWENNVVIHTGITEINITDKDIKEILPFRIFEKDAANKG